MMLFFSMLTLIEYQFMKIFFNFNKKIWIIQCLIFQYSKQLKMRTLHLSKTQMMHNEIRRKQNDHKFRMLRKDIPNLTPEQACIEAERKFVELDGLCKNLSKDDPVWKESVEELLKSLKQLSCTDLARNIFLNPLNLKILIYLQNLAASQITIDNYAVYFLHIILLNISGISETSVRISLKELSFKYFQLRQTNSVEALIWICFNSLLKDETSSTTYMLINSQKINILQRLLQLFLNFPQAYQVMENCVLSLTRVLVIYIFKYKFSQNCGPSFDEYTVWIYQKIQGSILNSTQEENLNPQIINIYFRTLKILLKARKVQFSQNLVEILQSTRIFSPSNTYYIQLMTSLAFHTCFSLKQDHIKICLQHLFLDIEHAPTAILRLISNSLLNDSSYWRTVYEYFIAEAHGNSSPDLVDRQKFPNTAFFVYFLNDQRVEYDICEIMGVIIYSQAGLGILEQCAEELAKSYQGSQKLRNCGYSI